MTDQLLDFLLDYGVAALLPILLASSIGVPLLPATLLLVAAGAFAGAGQLPLIPLVLGAYGSTLLGNGIGYWLGRRGGEAALARWGRRFRIDARRIAQADAFFGRYGGLAILFTRFPLSPLSAVINILAGAARYPIRPFALLNLVGVGNWVGVYVGLGYAFGNNWERLAAILNNATQALTWLVVIVLSLIYLIRVIRRRRAQDRAKAPPLDAAGEVDPAPAGKPSSEG